MIFKNMLKKNLFHLLVTVTALSLVLIANGLVLAWASPTANPPSGNVTAPLSISSVAQTKAGDLSIGSGLAYWLTKDGDSFALKNNAGLKKFILGQDGNAILKNNLLMEEGSLNIGGVIKISNWDKQYHYISKIGGTSNPRCACDTNANTEDCYSPFPASVGSPETCYDWFKDGGWPYSNKFTDTAHSGTSLTISSNSYDTALIVEKKYADQAMNITGNVDITGKESIYGDLSVKAGDAAMAVSITGGVNVTGGSVGMGWERRDSGWQLSRDITIACSSTTKRVIGGGCSCDGEIVGSYPSSDTQWHCFTRGGSGAQVFVICANIASTEPALYGGRHLESECTALGGTIQTDGSDKFCKFAGAACPTTWMQFKDWSTTKAASATYKNEQKADYRCKAGCYSWSDANDNIEYCASSLFDRTCSVTGHTWSNAAMETNVCSGDQVKVCGNIKKEDTTCPYDSFYHQYKDRVTCTATDYHDCDGATDVNVTASRTEIGCY